MLLLLGKKDFLSLFYGTIIKKSKIFRFVNLGSSHVFFAISDAKFKHLPCQGQAISEGEPLLIKEEGEIQLLPGSRLVIISHGFLEALGDLNKVQEILNKFRQKEALDLLNELVFLAQSRLATEDDMPSQDCTAIVLDPQSQLLQVS
jgi:hypothetical protein